MGFRDPLAAYNAANNVEAHLVCDLLVDAGIEAVVIEDHSQVGMGLTGMLAEIHKPQVWIERSDAERAAPVLAGFERKAAARREDTGEGVQVTCEECGKRSTFPSSMLGLVETCWHCGEYVDVEPDAAAPRLGEEALDAAPARSPATASDNPYRPPETVDDFAPAQAALPGVLGFLWIRGRITRAEWWTIRIGFVLFLYALDHGLSKEILPKWAELPLLGAACWLLVVSEIKRWHDHGRSGYWIFVHMVMCVGPLLSLLLLGFQRGTPGPNRYGPDPLDLGHTPVL